MGFNCGIVGLPNVGKSTLFNAIVGAAAAAADNYPFCTIEPNVGRVPVPDRRLEQVAEVAGSPKVLPTQLEVVDIAGLVRGASRGEGLGNRFLGAIREVDAILHVLPALAQPLDLVLAAHQRCEAPGHRRVQAAGPRGTRSHNLSLVLGEVLQHGPRSRASIAEATGLTKATI